MCENGPKSGGSGNYLNKCRAVPTLIFHYPIFFFLFMIYVYSIYMIYLYMYFIFYMYKIA
jgi:hypothetical protein